MILLGATLLFFYGLPTQQFSNVIVIGDQVVSWDGPGGPVSAESIDEIRRFQRGARALHRFGFSLLALGTLLQMIGAVRLGTQLVPPSAPKRGSGVSSK